jgi:site-specific recombinase XerD
VLRRKVGLDHVALLRAYFEGLDIKEAAQRYIDPAAETMDARRIIKWVLQEYISAARRYNHHGMARALAYDPAQVPERQETSQDVPTQDEWCADNFLSDETYRYQVERYNEFLASLKLPKRAAESPDKVSIRKLQRQALSELENYVREFPALSDPLVCWFDDRDADRFSDAGVITVSDLVIRVKRDGRRWWSKVKGFGTEAGARVSIWLTANADRLNLTREEIEREHKDIVEAEKAATPKTLELRPLEYLAWTESLEGKPAGPDSRLAANNDYEAFLAWLSRCKSKHTARSYQTQIERFWLWCIFEADTALSEVKFEHCSAYLKFLSDIARLTDSTWNTGENQWRLPRSRWVGTNGKARRHSPDWRPFVGPFGDRTAQHAYTVIKSFFKFLATAHYIKDSPWDLVPAPKKHDPKISVGHSLSLDHMQLLLAKCDTVTHELDRHRVRLAITLAVQSGMRLTELVTCKVGHFIRSPASAARPHYVLNIFGKGRKIRQVPIELRVFALLEEYLLARGLQKMADGQWNPTIPVFVSHRRKEVVPSSPPPPAIAETEDLDNEVSDGDEIFRKVSLKRKTRALSPGPKSKIRGVDYDQRFAEFKKQFGSDLTTALAIEGLAVLVPNGIGQQAFYEMFKNHCKLAAASPEAGDLVEQDRLRIASTHWLRHTFGSIAIKRGAKLTVLKDLMGHSDINTTTQYLEADKEASLDVTSSILDAVTPLK